MFAMHIPSPRSGSCPTPPSGGLRSRGLRSLGVFLGVLFTVLALLTAGSPPARAASVAATYQVTTLADSGAGSLRAAITSANGAAGSVITFKPGLSGTVLLASALPALAANMTITGPGASLVAVDGQSAVQPFSVNGGVTAAVSGLTIQNGNAGGNGGGFLNNGILTLTGCALTQNSAPYGYGGGVSNSGTLTLTGCTLTQNSAQGGQGGGVYNSGGATLTLTGCTLTQNSASFGGYGGGVYNSGTLTLTDCTLTQNSATGSGFGGGVFNDYGGTLTLTGCTLTQNSAQDGGYGGGVSNFGTLTLTGCTLTQNSAQAGYGGGVYNQGPLTLTDDILYGDSAPNNPEVFGSVSAASCDIQGRSATPDGSGNFGADPQFVSGTSPYDLHLKVGSPCIHVGTALPPDTLDHDGNPYAAPNPSLGAYEYGFYTVTNTADSGVGSLRAAITYANLNGNANGNAGTAVTFAPGLSGTVLLGSALPTLTANMTILGPGASVLAVDGQHSVRPFFVNGGVTAAVSGLTIQNGNAGGGYGGGVSNSGTLTLTGCTLTQNSAPGGYGGGVYNQGTLTLTGCTLTGNSAPYGSGGGVSNFGTLTLTGCTLTQNSVQDGFGGGVYNDYSGTLTLTGCTLTQNSTSFGGYGGGVYNSGTLTLTGCTLTQNSAPIGGGGVSNSGTATLTDDILYGDSAPKGAEVYGSVSAAFCDIQGRSATPDGSGNFGADPQFVSGTSPYDLHLKVGSPCIHVGTALPPDTLDHDGNPYAAPNPSLGAYEYGFYTVTNTADSGVGSLRAAITYANLNGNANGNAGTAVTFAPGLSGTVLLGSALPTLTANMTILGPGASVLAVDGQHSVRPFFVNGGVTAAVSGLTIQNGNAGGGYGGGVSNSGTLTLTGCTLTQNSAPGGYGGGVANTGTLTLTGCTLTQNSALISGGGVANTGTLTLTGCTLIGNSAPYGGGVFNYGTLTLTGCTLTQNSAPSGGGGVYNNGGPLTLTDDILYGDSAPNNPEVFGSASITACDIQQGGFAGSNGNLNADPRLASLGSYGGQTQTCALLPGSPCLGAGTNAGLTADQRGVPIPQGGRYDIGAFESRGFTVTVTGGSGQSATVGTAFASSLTATVTANFSLEPVAGGVLTFTGPGAGASATFSPAPATIGSTGTAGVTATANGTPGGPYSVTADTGAGSATYSLTNTAVAPAITTQPANQTVTAGFTATFSAAASGKPAPTVQWQVSTDGGSTFTNISGATSATYSFTATHGGSQYRAVFTNSAGSATTSAATLTVNPGAAAQFSAAAPRAATAGTPVLVTFRALDAFGNLATGYTGTVRFTSTDPQAGGVPANVVFAGGVGSVSVTFKTAGAQTVTGTDTVSSALTATTATITVAKAATTTTLTSSLNPSVSGQSVTFTATLSGGVSPGGSVTFTVDGTAGTPVSLSGTTAAFTTSALAAGTHSVTAAYSGDTNNTASTSSALTQTVNPVATDVTGQVSVGYGGFVYRRGTQTFAQQLTLTNTSGVVIRGPLTLALDQLSRNARLVSASDASGALLTVGLTAAALPAGSPTVTVQPGDLAPGASVLVNLSFSVPNFRHVTYAVRILSGSGV